MNTSPATKTMPGEYNIENKPKDHPPMVEETTKKKIP